MQLSSKHNISVGNNIQEFSTLFIQPIVFDRSIHLHSKSSNIGDTRFSLGQLSKYLLEIDTDACERKVAQNHTRFNKINYQNTKALQNKQIKSDWTSKNRVLVSKQSTNFQAVFKSRHKKLIF